MKIAVLTSGILPVPAVQGGAVENLIDYYLDYNAQHHEHDITIYSIADKKTKEHPALLSNYNHYHYIDVSSIYAKIRKKIFHWCQIKIGYYHYSVEYFLYQAIKHIRHQDYDVIIIENRPAYSIKLKEVTKAKLVFHIHNEKLDKAMPQYHDIYNSATCILTVSDYIRYKIQIIFPNDTKTKTVHNGINLATFSPKYDKDRKAINLSDNKFLLVFCGRINPEKGIMELIDAMLSLKDEPNIYLMVIGSSFFGNSTIDDEFIKHLKKKANSIQNHIIFTGFIPYQEIPKYLQMADVAVIPSIWDDPFPTTVLEAQAMGLPIITTRRGGIPEEVTEENAILLETDEHFKDNLVDAIRLLYHNPGKRLSMGKASLKHAQKFSKEKYTELFFNSIEDIVLKDATT